MNDFPSTVPAIKTMIARRVRRVILHPSDTKHRPTDEVQIGGKAQMGDHRYTDMKIVL